MEHVADPRAVAGQGPSRLPPDPLSGPRVWRGEHVSPEDWLVSLPTACRDELDDAVIRLRRDPLPVLLLDPADFRLDACAALMARVRTLLEQGIGLAVVDRVPVERYTEEENRALCWLLTRLLGRPVAQSWGGAMLYDVRDTGRSLTYGVRRSVTRLELTFHTDGPWLAWPPSVVGLYCLNPAPSGGISRFVSLCTVHEDLRARYPRALPRLYRPFPWDRQGEHAPEDDRVAWAPVFEFDGRTLVGRFNETLIEAGAALAGAPLDAEAHEALGAMREVLDAPGLRVEFRIERGQLQYISNRQFAHSRTDFRDGPAPHEKRHLIRTWIREEGRRTFHG